MSVNVGVNIRRGLGHLLDYYISAICSRLSVTTYKSRHPLVPIRTQQCTASEQWGGEGVAGCTMLFKAREDVTAIDSRLKLRSGKSQPFAPMMNVNMQLSYSCHLLTLVCVACPPYPAADVIPIKICSIAARHTQHQPSPNPCAVNTFTT